MERFNVKPIAIVLAVILAVGTFVGVGVFLSRTDESANQAVVIADIGDYMSQNGYASTTTLTEEEVNTTELQMERLAYGPDADGSVRSLTHSKYDYAYAVLWSSTAQAAVWWPSTTA